MRTIKSILVVWLAIAGVTTVVCGLVYLAALQVLRQSADDPQIQLAEDAANFLSQGAEAEAALPTTRIEMATSLAPFVIVFDAAGRVLATSGVLHGRAPHLPAGVLDFARTHGEHRVTWQPEPGVRLASVVVSFTGARAGYVLAGRSLREVEKRKALVASQTGMAWLAAIGISLVIVGFGSFVSLRQS